MALYIHGIGHFHPPNVIDNQFLESLNIETNEDWIMSRVGISERHTVLSLDYIRKTFNSSPRSQGDHIDLNNVEMSAPAIAMALERAQIKSDQIGLIIAGSCSPVYSLPADACVIAGNMNLTIPAFDINSACSTFVAHLYTINAMQTESLPDYILLVIADSTTRHVDYSDRSSCILWGDCATAMIVSKKIKSKLQIEQVTLASDPQGWSKITLPAGGYFSQHGQEVQKFAIKKMIEITTKMSTDAHLLPGQYHFIGHQANLRILQHVCEKMNIPNEKHLYNINQFGNCGAAGAPSVLSQKYEDIKSGDVIIMALVGAGLTWGGVLIRAL